ncbi:ABC-2 type transport system ATP-binding protein [Gracilibacillus ureilyticus]|uniref:ABC-2 type transport system ATP-binding protein n=1 Tax=Gracilibacillus ureilyticus TaxID=531814 RepID=A0A1H9TQ28_9BACI|nr:ABC transporter ATP-binding protein [Gracilibacillus ureilyticus]SER99215.1 ABC-2 type transport system ATP-binding protein [Gracilibacillus ureilyticus]
MIKIENISKKVRMKRILHDCNAELRIGRIIGIAGENGCGKTTLVKLLAGILKPTHGKITMNNNKDRSSVVAFSPDSEYFYPCFTIKQLIEFYHSQFKDFDENKAEQMADFFQLDKSEKIKYLSKGQLGRVKIVVTLSRKVPFLILDEPLAGLDPIVKQKIIKSIIQFVNLDEQTLLLTTHELLEIEPLLDEIIVMKNGSIIEQMDVEDIRTNKELGLQDWMEEIYI